MTDEKDKSIAELYTRIKWVLIVISKLWKQRFSGQLILSFHEGNLARKYKREVIEIAPE